MLPFVVEDAKDEDGDRYKCLRMFLLDSYERGNKIFMFGKVWVPASPTATAEAGDAYIPGVGKGSFQSICVQLRGLERQVFFLPRQWATPGAVDKIGLYSEIKDLLQKTVLKGSSDAFRCKFVERNYAFELPDVPREKTKYMKCKYSAKYDKLDMDTTGRHFSRVFGTQTSPLENFLIKRGIKGPCWIEIKDPAPGTDSSWSKVEAMIEDPKCVSVCSGSRNLEPPPVKVMSLSMKTRVNKKQEHEVAMISALVHSDVLLDKPTPGELDPSRISHFTVCRSVGNVGQSGHISESKFDLHFANCPPARPPPSPPQVHVQLIPLKLMHCLLFIMIHRYEPGTK